VKIKTLTAGNKGFTLLELLLVLFIIGMAASVVMISGSRLQEKSIFNSEARNLYLSIKHARELSIIERMYIVFRVDPEAGRYWIGGRDNKSSGIHSIPQKFIITGEDITFFPKGNSTGGKIEIDNGRGQKYEVVVDPVLGTPSLKRL